MMLTEVSTERVCRDKRWVFLLIIRLYFIILFSATQHWLEFTKSIAKQMKCKYLDSIFLIFESNGETVTMHNVTTKEKLFWYCW